MEIATVCQYRSVRISYEFYFCFHSAIPNPSIFIVLDIFSRQPYRSRYCNPRRGAFRCPCRHNYRSPCRFSRDSYHHLVAFPVVLIMVLLVFVMVIIVALVLVVMLVTVHDVSMS
ncbi:hypothetical protein ANN_08761 [Periplaneta americana]|uniref:Transmembrane protein n=1 Tax=Periplaneta americana TaxID=6978 RepID=A0ABQ8T401_PERAM|nr:hypothetical protein ANN_08761 [Periplaneta americana]